MSTPTTPRYGWRPGTRAGKLKADIAGEAFEQLRTTGPLTAKRIVDAARPEDAPLHPAFEWRDAVAAEKYRKHQANNLVRAIVVIRDSDDADPPEAVRRYYLVTDRGEPRYEERTVIAERPDLFASAIANLSRQMREARASLSELERMASDSAEPERMARIAVAAKALDTATAAITGLH